MPDSQVFNTQLIECVNHAKQYELKPSYLFYGKSAFLSDESAQLLVNNAKSQGYTHREIFYIDARGKLAPVRDSLQSPGLFDPLKIIEIRLETTKPTKAIGEGLIDLAQHLQNTPQRQILIIQAGEIDSNTLKTAWFKSLAGGCETVVSQAVYATDLPNWINRRAKLVGLTLTSDAVRKIVNFSQGNILLTAQMLSQLSHGEYNHPLTETIIDDLFSAHPIFNVNDLVYAFFMRQPTAINIVEKLKTENVSLVLIVATLYREFELIEQLLRTNLSFAKACQHYRIWATRQKLYQQALQRFSSATVCALLQQLSRLDRMNKGQEKGNGWLVLQHMATTVVCHKA